MGKSKMSLNLMLEKVLKEDALKKGNGDLTLREHQAKMRVQVIGALVPVTAIRLNKFSHFLL